MYWVTVHYSYQSVFDELGDRGHSQEPAGTQDQTSKARLPAIGSGQGERQIEAILNPTSMLQAPGGSSWEPGGMGAAPWVYGGK